MVTSKMVVFHVNSEAKNVSSIIQKLHIYEVIHIQAKKMKNSTRKDISHANRHYPTYCFPQNIATRKARS